MELIDHKASEILFDIGAATPAGFQEAGKGEQLQSLPNGSPADLELLGELAFGR
jgi:hypothetical protein